MSNDSSKLPDYPPIPDVLKPRPRDLWRLNSPTDEAFKPYFVAIGQASLTWNDLHESIAYLFCGVASTELIGDSGILLTIWHSLKSDRAQRELLDAAARRALAFSKITERMLKDIRWLLNETNKLSDSRNDAIHSPLMFLTNSVDETRTKVEVADILHPRARKLAKKDILSEVIRCRDRAIMLRSFCDAMHKAVVWRDQQWPDRPRATASPV